MSRYYTSVDSTMGTDYEKRSRMLIDASINGRTEEVKSLILEAKTDPNVAGKDGKTPLYWASFNGNIEVVKLLIDANADPNIADNDGNTPLHLASYYGRTDVVKLLLCATLYR